MRPTVTMHHNYNTFFFGFIRALFIINTIWLVKYFIFYSNKDALTNIISIQCHQVRVCRLVRYIYGSHIYSLVSFIRIKLILICAFSQREYIGYVDFFVKKAIDSYNHDWTRNYPSSHHHRM